MKICKASCICLCLLLMMTMHIETVSAADTISDAIRGGTVSGETKIWYQTNDNDANDKEIFHKENSLFDAGIRLGYITDQYAGFGIGLNFYAVDDLWAHNDFANGSIQGMNQGEDFSWLGEAYLTFNIGNNLLKIGRQNLKTPLVNSDEWALFPNNFMAYLFQNSDLPDTVVSLLYVTEERTRTMETFEDVAEDGVLMVGVKNESIPHTGLSGFYYRVDDDMADIDAVYLEIETQISIIGLSGQYILISPDTEIMNVEDTNAYGLKITGDLGVVNLSFAVTSVDDGTLNAVKMSDNGTKTPLYTATVSGDGDIAGATDTDGYKFTIGYGPTESFNLSAAYGYYDHGVNSSVAADDESTSIELVAMYEATEKVALYGAYLNTDHVTGAFQGADKGDNLNSIRVWARYQF